VIKPRVAVFHFATVDSPGPRSTGSVVGSGPSLSDAVAEALHTDCEWVTFVREGDVLTGGWQSVAQDVVEERAEAIAMIVTRPLRSSALDGAAVRDLHGLDARFIAGARDFDSREVTDFAIPDVSGVLFRISALRELRDSPRSEVDLLGLTLRRFPRLHVAMETIVSRGDDQVGSTDSLWHTLWALNEPSTEIQGGVHATTYLYWLQRIYSRELSISTKAVLLDTPDKIAVLKATEGILSRMASDAIIAYDATTMRADMRLLFVALRGDTIPMIGHTTVRGPIGRTELRYLCVNRSAVEEFFSADGTRLRRYVAKWRKIDYFGQTILWERIVWVDKAPQIKAVVDERVLRLGHRSYPSVKAVNAPLRSVAPASVSTPRSIMRRIRVGMRAVRHPRNAPEVPSHSTRGSVESSPYDGAWLLMDRVDQGRDSGEILFRYLRLHRPDINAWFVVDRAASDFGRIAAEHAHVLAYGSEEHLRALRHAAIVASSYVDAEMTHPVSDAIYDGGSRPWRFVYLQHGVLHNDLSLWFNSKPIDLMTTATRGEFDAIVRDGSGYFLTSQTVTLTGFPRHDVLIQGLVDDARPRDVILLAPTWRLSLMREKAENGRRSLDPQFVDSEFARRWTGLAADPVLRGIAAGRGCDVVLLPHPNMRGLIPEEVLPEEINIADEDTDVNALLRRAAVVVTDYSSIAFDAAIAGSQIAYYQFDRQTALGGQHTYLPGDFDYARDGLGPLCLDRGELLDALRSLLARTDEWSRYESRRRCVAEFADGHACERVTEAIQGLFK